MSGSVREAVPVLARRVVPADNSCLFTSVYYVVEGGVYDPGCAPEMRSLIAQIVASDPESYCEAVLGKTNREYCDWIMIAELTRVHEKQNLSHLVSAFGESQMVESYDMMM